MPSLEEFGPLMTEAWNTKDTAAWAALFTDPCPYVDVFGTRYPQLTSPQNQTIHEMAWKTIYKESQANFRTVGTQPVTAEISLVHIDVEVDFVVDGQPRKRANTIGLVVQGGKIAYFQNTPVVDRPGPPPVTS